jgi:hypothetical protein
MVNVQYSTLNFQFSSAPPILLSRCFAFSQYGYQFFCFSKNSLQPLGWVYELFPDNDLQSCTAFLQFFQANSKLMNKIGYRFCCLCLAIVERGRNARLINCPAI